MNMEVNTLSLSSHVQEQKDFSNHYLTHAKESTDFSISFSSCFKDSSGQSASDMKGWQCNSSVASFDSVKALPSLPLAAREESSFNFYAGWKAGLISGITCVHAPAALPCDLQVIPGSLTPSRVEGITSPPVTPPPSLPPSSRPAGDWVPLGPPVRRWTSTGWGGGGRHEGREGGHGLADGLDRQVLGVGPHAGCGPAARPTSATAHHGHGRPASSVATTPPPAVAPSRAVSERFRRLLELTNLSHYSRDTDQTPSWQTKKNAHHHPGLTQTPWKACS